MCYVMTSLKATPVFDQYYVTQTFANLKSFKNVEIDEWERLTYDK